MKPPLPGHLSAQSTPLSSNKRARVRMEHPDPLKSTQKNVLKNVPESVKTSRSSYFPSSELQKQRSKESSAKYDGSEKLSDKKIKKSRNEDVLVRDKDQKKVIKKAPVPVIRKGLKTGVLDLLGGNDSFLSTRSHSHRYSMSRDREEEREEKSDGRGGGGGGDDGDDGDIVEDEGSVRVRERERESDRRLLGLYKSNYEGFRPLNLGPKPITPAYTAAHSDSSYNSDLDDYGAEVWGIRAEVRTDPDRMYVHGTDGDNDPYSASYIVMGRQEAEEEEGVEGLMSSNQGAGIRSRFKAGAASASGSGMGYMSGDRGDNEEKDGVASVECSSPREGEDGREGGETKSAFKRTFNVPKRVTGDWKMRRVQEWMHDSETPLDRGEEEEEKQEEGGGEEEGRGQGMGALSERVRQSPLRKSSTSSVYSHTASPGRVEGAAHTAHTDRRNFSTGGGGEGVLEEGKGREAEGGYEVSKIGMAQREREKDASRVYDDSTCRFHESRAKSVFSSVTITGEISPHSSEVRKNVHDNENEKNERQAMLNTMERNFWVQDPLLQQQLGLLSDKKNILERLNNSDGSPYKEVEKEGEKFIQPPLSLPLSLPQSFPLSYSSALPQENFQFSLLSARADIHGIIGNSVNYHSGSLIGKKHGISD